MCLRHMAEREGFEPSPPAPPSIEFNAICKSEEALSSPIASPNLGKLSPELAKVVSAWPKLRLQLRAAILAIIASVEDGGTP